MRKVFFILSVFFLFAFTYPSKFEKKIDKTIKKTWDISSYKKELVSTPDSFDIQLYAIINNDSVLGYYSVNMVNSCRIGGCSLPRNSNKSGFENFWCLSVFDKDLHIKKLRVVEYNAEYGHEICSKNWLKQFIGKEGGDISFSKEINAISGATISAHSITDNINNLGNTLKELRKIKIL